MAQPLRIGILGGGQLGRMLLQSAGNYPVITYVLEAGKNPPAASLSYHFVEGDIKDFDTVYQFGKLVDVLTIEIEHVCLEALFRLEQEGLKIFPRPAALQIIKDKGLQKQFYDDHHIPTSAFCYTQDKNDLKNFTDFLPAVQKLRSGGYDGRGVEVLNSPADFAQAFDAPCVLEKKVDIDREISVIVAMNERGEKAVYPPVEMVFNPTYHLVDYLLSPATTGREQTAQAQDLALQVMTALNSPGIFAVEMFVDKSGTILVNETAPRAHNSGHQSIEGNYCSQYDMQMRMLQNYAPGNTDLIQPSLMLNLIGEAGFSGSVCYQGLDEVLRMKNVYVHLYGKHETRPGRKMGHITILGGSREELLQKAEVIKNMVKVISE